MDTEGFAYLPEEPASRHTRSRNTLVFSDERQLLPHHRDHPARYRFCAARLGARDRVLDCACGCGYGTAILAGRAGEVVGVDLHQDLLDFARAHWSRPNANFTRVDVAREPLPFPDGHFDAVVSLETIEHVADARALLAQFRRVLRPEGSLMLSTPQAPLGNPNHVHEFTLGELAATLESAGFHLQDVFLQTEPEQIIEMALPRPGRPLLVIAGRPGPRNPLARLVDNLERELRRVSDDARQERAALYRSLEQAATRRQRLEDALRDHQQAVADLSARSRELETEIYRLTHLRFFRIYERFVKTRLYRLLRRSGK